MATRRVAAAAAAALVMLAACGASAPTPSPGGRAAVDSQREPSLQELAAIHDLRIGSVYQDDPDTRYHEVFAREYNVMTAYIGWEMVHSESRRSFDFAEADRTIEFGERNGFEIHGHPLVWYYLIPEWVNRLPRLQVEEVMNEHIDRVVGRYAGRVKVWDVVNEALNDDGSDLRRGFAWSDAMGDEYVAKAFLRAHRADSRAVLRYNETGMESDEARFNGAKKLLGDLLARGAPVHALGWQMHLDLNFDSGALLPRMTEIAEMGIDNYITELDVAMPENPTATDYERQRRIYYDVVRIFLKAPRRRTIVVWGLRDGLDSGWLTGNHPLPFDEDYRPKPAYFGIREALSMTAAAPR